MAEKSELDKAILLNDSILVELEDKKEKTKGGIILPSSEKTTGRVVKVGGGIYTQNGKKIPMQVQVGDLVRLSNEPKQYQDEKLDGVTYKRATEREVALILER